MLLFCNDLAHFSFLQYALAAGLLASISCGIVGSYIVVRRSTYIAGAISHCVLGGMGAARYLQVVHHWEWLTPLTGATIAAVAAGLIISMVTLYGRERVDTVLSAIWALGMAIGVSFISITPGYAVDLTSYLFGSILMVTPADLALMAALNAIVVVVVVLFHNKFLALCFNEELARLRGINTAGYTVLLMVLTALTIVLLVQIVGILLVIALLTLPVVTASQITRRMVPMMLLSVLLSAAYTIGGLAVSYAPQLPAGATIIEFATAVYLGVFGARHLLRRMAGRSARHRAADLRNQLEASESK
jgi:zinc transport system permease protein